MTRLVVIRRATSPSATNGQTPDQCDQADGSGHDDPHGAFRKPQHLHGADAESSCDHDGAGERETEPPAPAHCNALACVVGRNRPPGVARHAHGAASSTARRPAETEARSSSLTALVSTVIV